MRRLATLLLLAGYGFVLAYLTLSPQAPHHLPLARRIQLYPFDTVGIYLHKGGWPMVVNILGNLAAFVPLGILWPILLRGETTARRVGLLSAGVSLAIELAQLATARRIADVDDVLLNALGGLIGYGVYRVVVRMLQATPAERPLFSPQVTQILADDQQRNQMSKT